MPVSLVRCLPRCRGAVVVSPGLPALDGDSRVSGGDPVSAPLLGDGATPVRLRSLLVPVVGGLAVAAPRAVGDSVAGLLAAVSRGLVSAVARGLAPTVARGLAVALAPGEAAPVAAGEAMPPGLAVAPALPPAAPAAPVVVVAPVDTAAPAPAPALTP